MSIITGDIKFYLTGGAANSDVNASLVEPRLVLK